MPVQDVYVVGHYRYHCETDSWWWSDGMSALYRGDVGQGPGLDRMVRHVHDDERVAFRAAIAGALRNGTDFGLAHGLVDPDGTSRRLMITGCLRRGTTEREIHGMTLDLESGVGAAARYAGSLELSKALASHALIDQAKGILMLLYGLDEDGAFELLRWSSMRANIKVLTIAHRIVAHARDLPATTPQSRDLVAELMTPATQHAPGRPARVATGVVDGYIPAVVVRGEADLRVAKELSDAARELWPHAGACGLLRIDLARTTRVGPTAADVLATVARHAHRDGIAVSVLRPADASGERERVAAGVTTRPPQSPGSAGARRHPGHRPPR